MLGDVAVIHGTRPAAHEVDAIVSFRHPRGVLWIESLTEVTRTPVTEILFGDAGVVCHRENGYTYHLDPQKVMFAQGNRLEKQRMARLIRDGPKEARVADMFAGIGYFTVPMAGSGARVHAMEINPVAFEYPETEYQRERAVCPGRGSLRGLPYPAHRHLRPGRDGAFRCIKFPARGLPPRTGRERRPRP